MLPGLWHQLVATEPDLRKTPVSYRSTSPEWFVPSRAGYRSAWGLARRTQ